MNNIEILEELKDNQYTKETLITLCKFYDEEFKPYVLTTEERDALENLIKENKELKEKQKEYEKQLDLDYVEKNYIQKSKIEKALDKMNERYMTPEAISNSSGATFNYWTGKRDMCIELLGEN